MKPKKQRPPKRKPACLQYRFRLPKTWKLTVSKDGTVTLPRAALREIGFEEGDAMEACVRRFANQWQIELTVQPHGLSRAEIAAAQRRDLREIKQDRKAGKLVLFTREAFTGRGKA